MLAVAAPLGDLLRLPPPDAERWIATERRHRATGTIAIAVTEMSIAPVADHRRRP